MRPARERSRRGAEAVAVFMEEAVVTMRMVHIVNTEAVEEVVAVDSCRRRAVGTRRDLE